jgi:hypothetical protein
MTTCISFAARAGVVKGAAHEGGVGSLHERVFWFRGFYDDLPADDIVTTQIKISYVV